jgi:hypothetical protein
MNKEKVKMTPVGVLLITAKTNAAAVFENEYRHFLQYFNVNQ